MYAELLKDCEEALNISNKAYSVVEDYAHTHLGWGWRNVNGYDVLPPLCKNAEYLKDAEFRRLVERAREIYAEYSRRVEVARAYESERLAHD